MALAQPKKPVCGAWGFFLSDYRPAFIKAYPGQSASGISKMAAVAWKKQSAAQKAPFRKKYDVAYAQFDKDMAAFLASGGVKEKGIKAQRAEKRKAKEEEEEEKPAAPKKINVKIIKEEVQLPQPPRPWGPLGCRFPCNVCRRTLCFDHDGHREDDHVCLSCLQHRSFLKHVKLKAELAKERSPRLLPLPGAPSLPTATPDHGGIGISTTTAPRCYRLKRELSSFATSGGPYHGTGAHLAAGLDVGQMFDNPVAHLGQILDVISSRPCSR
jgi:hypothetical protein